MAALARAIRIDEVEKEPSLVDGLTKDCFDCDVDNPRAVAKLMRKLDLGERPVNLAEMMRNACQTCGGSGQQSLAAAEIAKELKASKRNDALGLEDGQDNPAPRKKSRRAQDEDDLYLEY